MKPDCQQGKKRSSWWLQSKPWERDNARDWERIRWPRNKNSVFDGDDDACAHCRPFKHCVSDKHTCYQNINYTFRSYYLHFYLRVSFLGQHESRCFAANVFKCTRSRHQCTAALPTGQQYASLNLRAFGYWRWRVIAPPYLDSWWFISPICEINSYFLRTQHSRFFVAITSQRQKFFFSFQ